MRGEFTKSMIGDELVRSLSGLTRSQRSYVLGVIGASLLRDWHQPGDGQADRLTTLTEVVRLFDGLGGAPEAPPSEVGVVPGYSEWAAVYDEGPNLMTQVEEAWVRSAVLSRPVPGELVLDAACGTGRHAAWLAAEGFRTVGLDLTSAMLCRAARRVPEAAFARGDLEALPFASGSIDAAVCSLALCHVPALAPSLTELARVLKPGGRLVVSDPHGRAAYTGGQGFYGEGGIARPRYIRNHYRQASEWIWAFNNAGFDIESCHEPRMDETAARAHPVAAYFPDAAVAAFRDVPYLWVWSVTAREK